MSFWHGLISAWMIESFTEMETMVLDFKQNCVLMELEKSPGYSVETLSDSWKLGQPQVCKAQVQVADRGCSSVDSYLLSHSTLTEN